MQQKKLSPYTLMDGIGDVLCLVAAKMMIVIIVCVMWGFPAPLILFSPDLQSAVFVALISAIPGLVVALIRQNASEEVDSTDIDASPSS